MADYLTFQNIYQEVSRAIKDTKQSKLDLVKDIINMTYLNEVMLCDDLFPLFWLVDFDDTLKSVAPATISGITQASPGVITTAAAHGLAAGAIVSIYNIVGMTELNNRTFRVNTAPSTVTMTLIDLDAGTAIDTSGYTAYTSGGTIHHRGVNLATTGKNVQRIIGRPKWHDEDFMTEIDPAGIEADNVWMSDSTARPERYRHRKAFTVGGIEVNQLLWFQGADAAYNLRYWFERRCSPMSDNAHVPLLPPQFHHGIVAGAVMRLAEYNVQVESPAVWPGIYAEVLSSLRAFNRKFYHDNELDRAPSPFMI